MNSESVIQFDAALERGDDSSALSLLENGRVTFQSVFIDEADGVRLSCPLIFIAVYFVREEVARALVGLGANIDSFRDVGDGESVSPAGAAILSGKVPALHLCLRLGANMSCVYRKPGSPPTLCSSLELAIGEAKLDLLAFLLDSVFTARPVRLNPDEIATLLAVASRGSPAKRVFEILRSRRFNFKSLDLEEMDCEPSDENPGATSLADALLTCAQKSGDADLMHYLVKDLGLVSAAGRMESMKAFVDKDYALLRNVVVSPVLADLRKYKCEACEIVGATKVCGGCKASRYCSTKCQTDHWKTGGHKQECKNSRKGSKEAAKEGSAGASMSSSS